MTPERLKEIKERAEKATPGPWQPCDRGADSPEFYAQKRDEQRGMSIGMCYWPIHEQTPEATRWAEEITYDTVTFIAHARQDIPDLLEYVAHLERYAQHLPSCEKWVATWDQQGFAGYEIDESKPCTCGMRRGE